MPESMAALAVGLVDNFNNILTTVMGACSLIDRDDPANSELLQYVALIRASAERAVALSVRLISASTTELENVHSSGQLLNTASTGISERDKKSIHDIVATNNQPNGA